MDFLEIVRKDLIKLLPSSIVNEVICYCFYDDHPRDLRKIDIVVCTKRGEIIEFYKREIVASIVLENVKNIKEIFIFRNENSKLFYIVATEAEIIVLSLKEKLHIHLEIKNVESYELVDRDFSGLPCLKIVHKDDAVPLLYDSNFNLKESLLMDKPQSDSLPVMTQLLRKLTEAKYNVKKNEGTLAEYVQLKQTAAFSLYEKDNPNTDDSLFKIGTTTISKALCIKTKIPFVKLCNKKVIIIVNIHNENNVPIENLHILLHGIPNRTISYTTKIFEETKIPPYWIEKENQAIKNNEECFVVGVVDIKELKYTVVSKINFEAVLSFTRLGRSYVLPLENVTISAMDCMGENFDVFMSSGDDKNKILAILATSEKTEIILRHIDHKNIPINISEVLCQQLTMEVLDSMKNVLVYKKSSYHILYGLTLIFLEDNELFGSTRVQVYSRSPAQVLAFIHYMYDGVSYRIMATLPDHDIVAKTEDLAYLNSKTTESRQIDNKGYAESILKQSKLILEYFDECMVKMNENPLPEIQSKIGNQINLLSMGLPEFLKFRNKLLQESVDGIQTLRVTEKVNTCSEEMLVDE